MQDHYFYDYAVIRLVPKVDREEFINVGVIVSCPEKQFLKTLIEFNKQRLKAFSPQLDFEMIEAHLKAIEDITLGNENAGTIGKLSLRERFHLLTSPKSTIIQTSPVHSGYCKDPDEILEHLFETMVKLKK